MIVVFLLGLVVAPGVVAVLGACHHAANEADGRARYQAVGKPQWVEQTRSPSAPGHHYGFPVFREAPPPAFFDPGRDRFPLISPPTRPIVLRRQRSSVTGESE